MVWTVTEGLEGTGGGGDPVYQRHVTGVLFIYMVCVSQVKGASEEASQEVISNQSRSVCGQETRRGSQP